MDVFQLEQVALAYPRTAAVILAVLGGILVHLWTRFRSRMVVLAWSANHQHHAASAEHPQIGSIRVLVNETQARALFYTEVRIENPTVRDLTDLEIEFELPSGSTVVASEGRIGHDIRGLSWSTNFSVDVAAASEIWDEESPAAAVVRDKVSRWRAYHAPVFNRLSTATFSFLWENANTTAPHIKVGCAYEGLRMKFRKQPRSQLWGVDLRQAGLVGVVVGAIVVAILAADVTTFAMFVVGLAATAIGAIVTLGWRFLVRSLS